MIESVHAAGEFALRLRAFHGPGTERLEGAAVSGQGCAGAVDHIRVAVHLSPNALNHRFGAGKSGLIGALIGKSLPSDIDGVAPGIRSTRATGTEVGTTRRVGAGLDIGQAPDLAFRLGDELIDLLLSCGEIDTRRKNKITHNHNSSDVLVELSQRDREKNLLRSKSIRCAPSRVAQHNQRTFLF
ncbi:hypothetical protein [Azospirillum thermophilum]|uniref:hypothetical protein n=1 Tax=Azospirillum thermophilum TaxID=2202148 RepID=UPI0011B78F29|nr:hypothetical protein [Azospirillum thermophilum]